MTIIDCAYIQRMTWPILSTRFPTWRFSICHTMRYEYAVCYL